MGMIFLPKASFKIGTFSDPRQTHLGIFILELPPPPGVGSTEDWDGSAMLFRYQHIGNCASWGSRPMHWDSRRKRLGI